MEFDPEFYKTLLDNLYDGVYVLDRERRIVYWNRGAERITGFKDDQVIQKCCRDDILVHVDEQGTVLCPTDSCPAFKTMLDGLPAELEIFIRHSDGHRVPVLTRIAPLLNDGEIVGAVEIFSDNTQVFEARARIEELERMALLDPLTQIGNRRYGEIRLKSALGELDRYAWPFGVLMIDIDRFKLINDSHGHSVGDLVLKTVAQTLIHTLRSSDVLVRWGGEEFVALIPITKPGQLYMVARKMRGLVEHSAIRTEVGRLGVTISIGATAARVEDTEASVIERADSLMYQSKQRGRNRVTTDDE
jgi:diguanylate cyclase (GGDEF)-like protein/PAS domain S-box-containing protein